MGAFVSFGSISPYDVAVHAAGNVYVDLTNNTIHEFSPTGADLGTFASTGLSIPQGLAFSPPLAAAGTPGILTVNGNFTQSSRGTYDAELGGTTAGSGYDQINVTGTATLGGNLNISQINGFTDATIQLLNFASSSGSIANTSGLPATDTLVYNPTNLTLQSSNPSISNLNPSTATQCSPSFTLTVNGSFLKRRYGGLERHASEHHL